MQTRLTLRLDERLIRRARAFAEGRSKSVSQLVAEFFTALEDRPTTGDEDLPPVTRSLYGRLAGASATEEAYRRRLEEKHR